MTTKHEAALEDNNLSWVHRNTDALRPHQGKWIAVRNHAVIKSATEGEEVTDYLVDGKISGALLYRVPDDLDKKIYLIG